MFLLVFGYGRGLAQSSIQSSQFVVGEAGRGYGYVSEGAGLDLNTQHWVALLLRGSGNHLFTKGGTRNPLNPDGQVSSRHNFTRAQAGLRIDLPGHVSARGLVGQDSFDSHAQTLETSLSWWPVLGSYHPLQATAGTSYDDQTHVWSSNGLGTVGLRRALGLVWYGMVSGNVYAGGSLGRPTGRLGAGFSANHPRRGWGFSITGGGGSNGPYSDISLFHNFTL